MHFQTFEPYIVWEPSRQIRAQARTRMRGNGRTLYWSAVVFCLCLSIPFTVIEQILGTWEKMRVATISLWELQLHIQTQNFSPLSPEYLSLTQDWAETYSDTLFISNISILFMALVFGALSLGLTNVWMNVLSARRASTEQVIAGFENFPRATLLGVLKTVMIVLWSFLLLIPGVVAYYRYSCAFYLLSDNPRLGPFQTIALSTALMRGNKMKRFILDLSFLGWYVLATFVISFASMPLSLFIDLNQPGAFFLTMIGSQLISVFVLAGLISYNGVAGAEFYRLASQPIRNKLLADADPQAPPRR
jgi:uncharacterized membrane protein